MGSDEDSAMESERNFNQKNIADFRANGGKISVEFEGFTVLLLTSTGAKTGAERVNPVGYFDIDHQIYIVGSANGRDRNPAWVANIRTNPLVHVEIGADPPAAATASELAGAERHRIFESIKQQGPVFADYEAATQRVIPVFEVKLHQSWKS